MNKELIAALAALEESKGISKEVILQALEKALEKSYEKNFNDATNVEVKIDKEKGDIYVYALKTAVNEVTSLTQEVHIDEARKLYPKVQEGDIVRLEVKPKNFGRVAAQTARNIVIQQIRDAERRSIHDDYIDRVREMITGVVQRIDFNNVYINLGKAEGVISPKDQIPGEVLEPGQRVKLLVSDVHSLSKGPQIILSRSHPDLVVRLFEQEVPEIMEGLVEVYSVAREAGSRTKIAVFANDPNIDPIGACVGYKGNRVNIIVEELNDEKMDIVIYDKDPRVFIANALSPSKVEEVKINEEEKIATVLVPEDQLSLAIGKEGQNVRLAARLTGWKIDINAINDQMDIESSEEDGGEDFDEPEEDTTA